VGGVVRALAGLVVITVGDQAGEAQAGLNGFEYLIEGEVRIFGGGALALVLRCVGIGVEVAGCSGHFLQSGAGGESGERTGFVFGATGVCRPIGDGVDGCALGGCEVCCVDGLLALIGARWVIDGELRREGAGFLNSSSDIDFVALSVAVTEDDEGIF